MSLQYEGYTFVFDIDGTLCPIKEKGEKYEDLVPYHNIVDRIRYYSGNGARIILFTSRNMNSYNGNIGLINKNTARILLDWLEKWDIPYDEIIYGKPWPGHKGFYVDDRTVRPDEFLENSVGELDELCNNWMERTKKMENKHTLFTTTVGEKETMEKVGGCCQDREAWKQYRERYTASLKCDVSELSFYPIQLEFELNGTCNYRCESCTYRLDKEAGARPEIDFNKYCEIVSDGVKKGLGAIRFNYHNEPLLKRDIARYIRFAKSCGVVDTYLSTNGSLLDEDMSVLLIEAGLDRLQVSVDAFDAKTYGILRPGGSYERVVDNIRQFMKIRNEMGHVLPAVRVNFVKQPDNVNQLQEFCEYWQKEGVDSIGIQDFSDWMTEKDFRQYEDLEFKCNMPFNRLTIRYNGDVLPCCLFLSDQLTLGNIYDHSIEKLWNCEQIKELRILHSRPDGWKENEVCRKCVMSLR